MNLTRTPKQMPRDLSSKVTSILLIEENQLLVDLLMLQFAHHDQIRLLQPDGLPQIERAIAEVRPDLALIGYEKFTPKAAQALLRLPIFSSSTAVAILTHEVDKAALLALARVVLGSLTSGLPHYSRSREAFWFASASLKMSMRPPGAPSGVVGARELVRELPSWSCGSEEELVEVRRRISPRGLPPPPARQFTVSC